MDCSLSSLAPSNPSPLQPRRHRYQPCTTKRERRGISRRECDRAWLVLGMFIHIPAAVNNFRELPARGGRGWWGALIDLPLPRSEQVPRIPSPAQEVHAGRRLAVPHGLLHARQPFLARILCCGGSRCHRCLCLEKARALAVEHLTARGGAQVHRERMATAMAEVGGRHQKPHPPQRRHRTRRTTIFPLIDRT